MVIPVLHPVGNIEIRAVVKGTISQQLLQLQARMLHADVLATEILAVYRGCIRIEVVRVHSHHVVIIGGVQAEELDTLDLFHCFAWPDRRNPRRLCDDAKEYIPAD